MGATVGFAAGVFDLSFASLATLGAALSVTFISWFGLPMWAALPATAIVCALVGIINSIVVVIRFHVTAFLATLAMQFVLDGLILTYSGGSLINPQIAGAALIDIVENGLYAMAFPYYSINIVKGIILLIVLIMTAYSSKNSQE